MFKYWDHPLACLVSRSTKTEKIYQDVRGSTEISPPRVTTHVRVIGDQKLRDLAKTLPYAAHDKNRPGGKELVTVGGRLEGTCVSYAYVHIWEA
jgi:hypothetical protein